MSDVPVRDAATLIVYRHGSQPEILMGQRSAKAAFMPDKVVFPGGGVSSSDAEVRLSGMPSDLCSERLSTDTGPSGQTLLAAAIRELWEETGLILGLPGSWPDPPPDWESFAASGHRPSAARVRFVFRAITPPGRPRRFDARFFLVSHDQIRGEIGGDGELSNLQWIALDRVRSFNLPFVTQIVLAELPKLLADETPPPFVPFYHGQDQEIRTIKGGERSSLGLS